MKEFILTSNGMGLKTILKDGVCPYTQKTRDEYIAEGYTIYADNDEWMKIIDKNQTAAYCTDFEEITEDQYYYALEVLPPRRHREDGFFGCEAITGMIHACFVEQDGKYFSSCREISTPWEQITADVQKSIQKIGA